MIKYSGLIVGLLALGVTGCSTYNSKFECVPGSGLGCMPARKVHKIIEAGEVKAKITAVHGTGHSKTKTAAPLNYNLGEVRYLTIWLAPQVDEDGSISSPQYVEVLAKE